jgi:hypothetical protein
MPQKQSAAGAPPFCDLRFKATRFFQATRAPLSFFKRRAPLSHVVRAHSTIQKANDWGGGEHERPLEKRTTIHMTRKEWFYAALALVGGLVGGIAGSRLFGPGAAAAAETYPKSVAAQEFKLVDNKGKALMALRSDRGGDPSFEFYDHAGKLRAGLGIDSDQELGLKLYDSTGKARITFTVGTDGASTVRMYDAAGQARELMGVDNGGEPALMFYASDGKFLRQLP